ncbi:Double-stranded RNA binding motif [Fragilaria crotonensis]|nr:Double-stranded RNA binding motif [Fragilaria crotonensis]
MLELRPYQARMVNTIMNQNAICKMPTGSGKTIVAAAIVKQKIDINDDLKCLILVPTRELVNQQALVMERWCPGSIIGRYHGGLSSDQGTFHALVSSPAAFHALLANNSTQYAWESFSLVVFDEVHHVLKAHPYRLIAKSLSTWHRENIGRKVQILGLSASLTYNVSEVKIKNTLNQLCTDLAIEIMLSPSMEELEADGYTPQHGRNVEVLSARHSPIGVLPQTSRTPHLMREIFMKRIEEGSATVIAADVMRIVALLEEQASTLFPAFQSPLPKSTLSKWEGYANELSKIHTLTEGLFASLECWYVAARVLVQTWEEEDQIVLHWLKMNNAIARLPTALQQAPSVVRMQLQMENEHHQSKLSSLQSQIMLKKEQFGPQFKCIVFVQQRFTAMVVANYLNQIDGTLNARFVASRGSSVTPSIKLTGQEVAATIESFKAGRSLVLVATSVIEEGFDVPHANVVILYDHLKDSVELCQRFGRARTTKCAIVVMVERQDRPLVFLERIRLEQDQIVQSYDPSKSVVMDPEVESAVQHHRERAAFQAVLSDWAKCIDTPLLAFNEYVIKTKAAVDEKIDFSTNGKFTCELTYTSILQKIISKATAGNKKGAKILCCKDILLRLRDGIHH